MAFIKHIPYGSNKPTDLSTTCESEIQIWQELTMLRHITGTNSIYARETTSSYIDQAKIYFLDASKSNWRTAGLLYYYSFLNLAKAHLITKRAFSGRNLKSTSIYHGLNAAPQSLTNIINFKIDIHPPGENKNRNIFSNFYQKLLNENWPFNKTISVSISQIIPYCEDISHEIYNFYSIPKESINILSLIRLDNNFAWLELLVPNFKVEIIKKEIGNNISRISNYADFSPIDKSEWLTAHNISATHLKDYSLIRINQEAINKENRNIKIENIKVKTDIIFKNFILPTSTHNFDVSWYWQFIPEITLNNLEIKWHPLLSNYLFAFMLSTILRYQPHLFQVNSKDSFIAEAWCNQSASSTLRYFLMELSKQKIRMN